MKPQALKRFTILFPVVAILVSTFIVTWEYARRGRLASELKVAEREYDRLTPLLPSHAAEKHTEHHDHDDHDDR